VSIAVWPSKHTAEGSDEPLAIAPCGRAPKKNAATIRNMENKKRVIGPGIWGKQRFLLYSMLGSGCLQLALPIRGSEQLGWRFRQNCISVNFGHTLDWLHTSVEPPNNLTKRWTYGTARSLQKPAVARPPRQLVTIKRAIAHGHFARHCRILIGFAWTLSGVLPHSI
jgi:hypothetical protein